MTHAPKPNQRKAQAPGSDLGTAGAMPSAGQPSGAQRFGTASGARSTVQPAAQKRGAGSSWAARRFASALAALALVSPVLAQDDSPSANLFQLYNTQAARARAEKVGEHVAAQRWAEAIAELQALIEEHEGEVLSGSRPQAAGARNPSQSNVHAGASSWAVSQLFALPETARQIYRRRFESKAEGALGRAISEGDRGALARLAQRWPLTDAAQGAWWALGDLELELGHGADGLRAWARAAAIALGNPSRKCSSEKDWVSLRDEVKAAVDAGTLVKGALARTQYAVSVLTELEGGSAASPSNEASFVRGPASGIAAEFIETRSAVRRPGDGGPESSGWAEKYSLPEGPFRERSGAGRLFPQRFGDTVFVNTSRSVHAIGAFDGRDKWTLPAEALGWGEVSVREYLDFGEAVDTDERMVTVAASRGIVVAALQIPVAFQDADRYNDLDIIQVMPERRLVAMDTENGDVLWTTMPLPGWDGESGKFSERMTVVGPPTIIGARVLVPMARLRDRIQLHLACFDLTSGEVLWSNPIVTGQRELNMFGRATKEYSSPAPVVAGDKVILQTQLGLIASVDLFTGETLWETLYEQVSVHAPQFYKVGWIENQWRNAPPILVGDTIVATPQDGHHLMALDLDTGALIWSVDQREIYAKMGLQVRNTRRGVSRSERPMLIGADEKRVFVGGRRIACFEFEKSVRQGPRYRRRWLWPLDEIVKGEAGFPVMDDKSVFVPNVSRFVRLDKMTGLVEEEISGSIASGNVLISDGMLFGTNGRDVKAHFEWRAMVARARAACAMKGATLADAAGLVRLLLERADSITQTGRDIDRALALSQEARAAMAKIGAASPAASLPLELHRAFMLSARAKRLLGEVEEARSFTLEALGLGLKGEQELESLLVLAEIERTRSKDAQAAVLRRLREEYGDATFEVTGRLRAEGWTAKGAFREALRASRERSGARRDPWVDPWTGTLVPTAASLTRKESITSIGLAESEEATIRLSGKLFARIGEAAIARTNPTLEARLAAELGALHSLLEESPAEDLFDTTSALWAVSRIQSLRLLHPDSTSIAALDARAEERLRAAEEAARSTGSTELLEAMPRLFPGSSAARRAAEARVEFALATGTPAEIASIVVEALPRDWHPARSSEQETDMLLRLAETLGGAGNLDFRAGLGQSLARFQPDAEVRRPKDMPGTGATTLRAVADHWLESANAASTGADASALPEFDATVLVARRTNGDFVPVGRGMPPGPDAEEIGLFASAKEILAIPTGRAGVPLWRLPISLSISSSKRDSKVIVSGSNVILAERDAVMCVDLATGAELWTFSAEDRGISTIYGESGVCVVVTDTGNGGRPAEVYGLDAMLGVELWYLNSIGQRYYPGLKVGNGRVVLLPLQKGPAAVHDVFTGYPVTVIETGRVNVRVGRAAWIDHGRLVLPYIESANSAELPNAILAYDLDDGSKAWRIDLDRFRGERRNLLGIVDMPDGSGGRSRLAMLQPLTDGSINRSLQRTSAYAVHCLDEKAGRVGPQRRLEIENSTRILGVDLRRRVTLESPLMVVASTSRTSNATILHAVGPDLATLWKVPSARKILVPGAQNLPAAVLSKDAVAMMVNEPFGSDSVRSSETKLMFLDAATGKHLETRRLGGTGLAPGGWRHMTAFGRSLVVAGSRLMDVMEAPAGKNPIGKRGKDR